jgi:hypothetical protein
MRPTAAAEGFGIRLDTARQFTAPLLVFDVRHAF